MSETPRVWVGCLGCYNNGNLIGEWFDAVDAPLEMDEFTPRVFGRGSVDQCALGHVQQGHEELWVMDHEGFAGLLEGECSPSEARRMAEILDAQDEPEAFAVYVRDHLGLSYAAQDWDAAVDGFMNAWCGWWDSEANYAYELAEDAVEDFEDRSGSWPFTAIDWNHAWNELRMGGDNWSSYVDGHGYAIFNGTF